MLHSHICIKSDSLMPMLNAIIVLLYIYKIFKLILISILGITSDRCKIKSEGRNSNFYARHKYILITGMISILSIILCLTISNLIFSIISGHSVHDTSG